MEQTLLLTNAAAPSQLQLSDSAPQQWAFYFWGNVSIMVWTGRCDVMAVRRMTCFGEQRRRDHPEGLSTIHVVKENVPVPDSETREEFKKTVTLFPPAAAVAVVFGGSGFWASTMRSVVTRMHVVSRAPYELRLHGRLEEVIEWLPQVHKQKTGVTLEPSELLRALKQASEGIDSPNSGPTS